LTYNVLQHSKNPNVQIIDFKWFTEEKELGVSLGTDNRIVMWNQGMLERVIDLCKPTLKHNVSSSADGGGSQQQQQQAVGQAAGGSATTTTTTEMFTVYYGITNKKVMTLEKDNEGNKYSVKIWTKKGKFKLSRNNVKCDCKVIGMYYENPNVTLVYEDGSLAAVDADAAEETTVEVADKFELKNTSSSSEGEGNF